MGLMVQGSEVQVECFRGNIYSLMLVYKFPSI